MWPAVVMALAICTPSIASAQSTTPSFRLTLQSGESRGLVNKDVFGKPCLDIEAASRAHVSNPNVYDHIVSIANRCARAIKVKVCYYGTEKCVDAQAPGSKRKDILLGIRPGMRVFRFSSTEQR